MNRRHKRYASVLGVAVVALVADRLFLAPDEAAADYSPAAEAVTSGATPTAPVAVAASAAPSGSFEASVAARLEAIADEQPVNETIADAFELPEAWGGHEEPEAPEAPVQVEIAGPAFDEVHSLQAAMANGAESMAIVDGHTVRIGEIFDGMRLEEVRERSAIFSSPDGQRVELPLE
jgi:hypothetical protein